MKGKEAPTFVPSWLGKTPSPQIAWFTFFFVFSRDLELTRFGQTLDSLGKHLECWWHGRGRLWALCRWCDCAQAPPASFCKGTFTQNVLLLLSRFSRVRLCATPYTAAHQASPSLGFSRQEHWSGLPFPSPMHESEKWKWSRSVVPDS